jgi:hypothetical protein
METARGLLRISAYGQARKHNIWISQPAGETYWWIIKSVGVGVMVTKQLSIAIAISICIGSGIALETFAAASASAARNDFDQVFADATRQSQSQYVNRARKSNRLNVRSVLQETALLPNCEPLASPFADPILGKVVGRCDA